LQVHVRDYPGFEETARKILMSKPSLMQNWVTLAAACFANRNYTGCMQSVESILSFADQAEGKSKMKRHEKSEIILIGLRALEAQVKYQAALDFLKSNETQIVDNVAKHDHLGRIH